MWGRVGYNNHHTHTHTQGLKTSGEMTSGGWAEEEEDEEGM